MEGPLEALSFELLPYPYIAVCVGIALFCLCVRFHRYNQDQILKCWKDHTLSFLNQNGITPQFLDPVQLMKTHMFQCYPLIRLLYTLLYDTEMKDNEDELSSSEDELEDTDNEDRDEESGDLTPVECPELGDEDEEYGELLFTNDIGHLEEAWHCED